MEARVLVVDDEEEIRTLLTRSLRRRGYHVEEAADGIEGLARVEQAPPEVVVTDMAMPRLDGIGLLKALKERHPDLPVIVLTGHGSMENVLQAMREGVLFDYLMKPLPDLALLDVAVLRAVEVRRLRARAREADQVAAMRELTVTAADRILNPLNVMALSLALLRHEGTHPEAVARAVTKIEEAMGAISRVIHQMSRISRYAPQEVVQGLRMIDLDSAAPESGGPKGVLT
jgi:DNA-binding NtrC family response regulator